MGPYRPFSPSLGILLVAIGLFSIVSLSGCLGPIQPWDRFNSTTTYNLSFDNSSNICAPLAGERPCTCMVCANESPSALGSLWGSIKSLFKTTDPTLESTLAKSTCQFVDCNRSVYLDYIALGPSGKSTTCLINGQTQECVPRFFMLGQGSDPAQFAMAQRYCAGRLTMPVIWAKPPANADGTLSASVIPAIPSPATMMCYLSRNQMPVVVPYADGRDIPASYFTDLASHYNKPNDDPAVSGPVIITTQAFADPLLPPADPSQPGIRLFNQTALNNAAAQVLHVKAACPQCLTALAINAVFNDSGLPDLCGLDYLLNKTPGDPNNPNACAAQFGLSDAAYTSLPGRGALRYKLVDSPKDPSVKLTLQQLDMIGVGFLANDDPHIPSGSAQGELAGYLLYSRQSLNAYWVPSVWYAVGFAVGPTASGGYFGEDDVSGAYGSILAQISGFAASGVIGVAPYRFLDAPGGLPIACTRPGNLSFTAVSFADEDGVVTPLSSLSNPLDAARVPGHELDAADGTNVTVTTIASSTPDLVSFIGGDSQGYIAQLNDAHQLQVYQSACTYGFRDGAGNLHPQSSFTWFSNCKYYYTDNASFSSNPAPSLSERSTQQPIMFSTNGRGSVCAPPVNADKMASRVNAQSEPVTAPTDPAELLRLNSLQCGGACLADTAMPPAFCAFASSFNSFDKRACTQYLQMDDAFQLKGLDPVLMRAFAIGESSLGNGVDSGASAPACAMSPGGPCGGGKSPAVLAHYPSDYCDATTIQTKAGSLDPVCALGVMQCIKAPSATYNPFDPYQSALCGSDVFLASFNARKSLLLSVNTLKSELKPAEYDWYAAWLTADSYYGMWVVSGTANFHAGDLDTAQHIRDYPAGYAGGFVQYMEDYYTFEKTKKNPHPNWQPDYGLRVVRRYNAGLQVCGSGCTYNSCGTTV